MIITSAALPRIASRALSEPPPAPDPAPLPDPPSEPKSYFTDSARSGRRDLLFGLALAAGTPGVLPPTAGKLVSGIVGGLGLLSGYGEVREGMRRSDIHQVLDGALHMGISVSLLAVTAVSSPLVGAFISTGGYTLLAGKMLYDHPRDVLDVVALQPLGLIRDAGRSVWLEFRPEPEPEKPAQTTTPAEQEKKP